MTKPTILVTGASGKTGSAVVAQLCERGWPVRAMVRSRDARSERLERLGAEIAVADLFDYDALRAAMAGTSRGYFCPPFHPHMLHSAVTFTLAARATRRRRRTISRGFRSRRSSIQRPMRAEPTS